VDILVTYDIADTNGDGAKRLRSIAAVCEGFGIRSQFSVFECRVSPTGLARLIGQIEDAIDPQRDSVHIYRLGNSFAESREAVGLTRSHTVGEPWIV